MPLEQLLTFLFISVLGVVFFIAGVLARLGYFRWIYAMKGHLVLAPPAFAHIGIFAGLIAIFLGVLPFLPIAPEKRGDLVIYILLPLVIATYVLAIWQPWWLKPTWLRWLEREHGDIIELLWKDVRKDRWAWERRVRTQAQLEAWVAEIRRKHGRDHPNAGNPFT